ncbi:hypothetical protein F7725_021146 [Dissostichus mawsoni]|uniref:AP complex mu/sigma subunit domain-containing protein n=1 Tax=Dissostichus mawsoni TaxID=36200 RepID=A0A7J5YIJ8_DISMA|nr:hypothetical protein F7725_021146 [Dissostichus mawsoni]
MRFLLLFSRQGKLRLQKWFTPVSDREKKKVIRDMVLLVYASLYFCSGLENNDNELLALEVLHRYVELLDKYFGNAYYILDEFLMGGEVLETKVAVSASMEEADTLQESSFNVPEGRRLCCDGEDSEEYCFLTGVLSSTPPNPRMLRISSVRLSSGVFCLSGNRLLKNVSSGILCVFFGETGEVCEIPSYVIIRHVPHVEHILTFVPPSSSSCLFVFTLVILSSSSNTDCSVARFCGVYFSSTFSFAPDPAPPLPLLLVPLALFLILKLSGIFLWGLMPCCCHPGRSGGVCFEAFSVSWRVLSTACSSSSLLFSLPSSSSSSSSSSSFGASLSIALSFSASSTS